MNRLTVRNATKTLARIIDIIVVLFREATVVSVEATAAATDAVR